MFLGHLLGMKPEHLQLFFGYFSLTNAQSVLTFGALLDSLEGHIPGRGLPAICCAWWLTFGEWEFGDSW